ncbi:diacylglycerol kinase delta isoform X2 [Patella vulgata]|uniref:diacylglycerol kinase delta isoform X2 n=1 Tax=Patella vulgata TaxID=6465 RepID=UPI00217F77F5|nr:diacylglycerol kinase delta isoform X2 [Patella vulgata]
MAAPTVGKLGSSEKMSEISGQDESSESDGETEPARVFHRRISTNKEIKKSACIKEGPLMKQTSSFQRWKKRYFKLKGRKLYYAKNHKSLVFDEIDLTNLSVAECSTKNINHSFQVITPFRNLILCADSRREMEEWISALKMAANKEYYEASAGHSEIMSGLHNWYACSHARPTYCNVCKEALSGVTSHGLSCEVCKYKAHKRCAVRAPVNCKWTSLASIGKDIIEDEDGISMPHQWLEGNLPVSAKCLVCDKTCGSVLRLQDLRCLWCRAMVHTSCKDNFPKRCPLGQCRVSILPPTAINNIDSDGYWEASRPPRTSPLLVYVNTKSGDNQGVKFLRRFKQLLNPAQVFDLMNGGPYPGLRLFQKFDSFRILICGGDGSIGWVLSEIDKLGLHKQCQIGVLPFGTGNDLARVLGWGAAFDDDTQLPTVLEKMEHAQIKMLDRWSIWTYEGSMPPPRKLSQQTDPISQYEDSMAAHLTKILHCEDHQVVISSAKVLCETVKDFVAKVGQAHENDGEKESEECIANKCTVLNEKLESLLTTLNQEQEASAKVEEQSEQREEGEEPDPVEDIERFIVGSPERERLPIEEMVGSSERNRLPIEMIVSPKVKSAIFKPKDALMCRANSLKKVVRQIIEHTEKAVDEQNAQTEEHRHVLQHIYTKNTLDISNENSRSAPSFAIFSCDQDQEEESMVQAVPEGSRSPRGLSSRRISSMSTFNRSASVGSNLCERDKSPVKDAIPAPKLGTSFAQIATLPGINSAIAKSLGGGSFISKVLLANADALCAAASPLIEEEVPHDLYTEKCVMNNYFGIGLDAKITLMFQNKREEHPEKCRSRTKNLMWYGVLGGKEILHRSFKNLDQKVLLECDGQRIPLPSLQGIVILNIPSYGGGANFWGGTKEDLNFTAPSFDDKILEVVAVFGGVQMAVSRVIDLQHHRIAQCRTVKISILGDEGVPVQVDGEAWTQPPGYIRIVHKNRAQMLTRDRMFENVLKSWSEKQKVERLGHPQPASLTEEEAHALVSFVEAAANLIRCVKAASKTHTSVEQELFPLSQKASDSLDRLYPSGKLSEPTLRIQVTELIHSVKVLYTETNVFLSDKSTSQHIYPDLKEKLSNALSHLEDEMQKILEIGGTVSEFYSDEALMDHKRKHGKLKQVYNKMKGKGKERGRAALPQGYDVRSWTTEEVGHWLETLALVEYKEQFSSHEIRGSELLNLERGDLKDLGVTKVGHLKRIQQGIRELINREAALEKLFYQF